ncbi:hypothetical protein [Rhodoferax sp. U11-2br]|uniref:hypothetical protein n=1 Tax=Rhodoferax sp. U11-2br TaxID=2838878 RepID=UPI001BE59BCB|nr:hypothetical protein [Rhodoferax sp. U11-2br]MBT3068502.1 hypothetical protein [Rhodoferax sp. U11-2br]
MLPQAKGRRWALLLLYTPLLASTLLAKLSVPPFAAQSLSIAYLFILLAMVLGLLLGYLRLDTARLSFFLLFIGCIGTIQVFSTESFSLASMLLLVTLYSAYVLCLPSQDQNGEQAMHFFLQLASVLALAGIAQYGVQLAFGARFAFPVENFVPDAFLIHGFNAQAPIAYGDATFRVNGIVFAEPSFFSQFMAVAIVIELLTHNRLANVALYALALMLSYSGTGVLVLAVCGPLVLITRRHWGLAWLTLGGSLLLVVLGSYLDLDKFTGRIGEFGSTRSSASARFISGFWVFEQYLWPYPMKALFGYGAGAFPNYAIRMPFPVAEMTLFKMVFEYGVLGATLYFCFIFYCVFRSTAPILVRLAVALTLLLNGPFVPFFHGMALSLLVWPQRPDPDTLAPSRASP